MARIRASIDSAGRIALACAGAAALAAALTWLQPAPGPVQADSAAALLFCALGLVALATSRPRAAVVLGAMAISAGLANLVPSAVGFEPNPIAGWLLPDAARMAPHTALAIALFGSGLLFAGPGSSRRLRSVGAGVMGGSVTVLGLTGLGAHALDFESSYGWSALASMPLAIAAGLVSCGVGLVALIWQANAADRRRYGLGISYSVATGLLASFALAALMLDQDGRNRQEVTHSELERMFHTLAVVTDVHAIGLDRMADRWNKSPGAPLEPWRLDARNHLAQASAFTALGWVAAGADPVWETAAEPPPQIPRDRLEELRRAAQGGDAARFTESLPEPGQMTASIALEDGGTLLAVLETRALVELAWGGVEGDQLVTLANAAGPLYARGRPDAVAKNGRPLGEQASMTLRGLDWRLRVSPPDAVGVGAASALSFIAGTCLTLLMSFSLALRRTAIERAEALESLSRELEASADQLMATNTELLRSNEELGRFATLASHDLQEPLRQITSFSERLQERYGDALDEHGRTYLGFVSEAAARARVMIEDLLRYARIDGQALRREEVDCNVALQDASDQLRSRIEETHAVIRSDSLPLVKGNSVLLTQLFQNLVGNALKYHGKTPPRIHVGVRDAGDLWEFSVRDEGIGIDPDYHHKIFEIFERIPFDEADEVEGTGVGLALCKKVVERLGGRIRVESTPGQGSAFLFSIPKLGAEPVVD